MNEKPDEQSQDIPHGDAESAKKGEEARKELDEIPAPGTDPLHEGP